MKRGASRSGWSRTLEVRDAGEMAVGAEKGVESERRTTAAVRVVRGVSCARECGGLLVPRLSRLGLLCIGAFLALVRVVGRGTGRLRTTVHARL